MTSIISIISVVADTEWRRVLIKDLYLPQLSVPPPCCYTPDFFFFPISSSIVGPSLSSYLGISFPVCTFLFIFFFFHLSFCHHSILTLSSSSSLSLLHLQPPSTLSHLPLITPSMSLSHLPVLLYRQAFEI